jgi:hypothetical protein
MKFTLLAAAALIATPVIAQDTMGTAAPQGSTQTAPPTTTDPATTTSSDPAAMQQTPMAPQTDAAAPAPMDPAMNQPTTTVTNTAPMATDGDPVGGYQPSAPAMQGGMQPGATVRFQAAPPAAQAYPAPAPLASYPICKRGQYDNCRQRGGR